MIQHKNIYPLQNNYEHYQHYSKNIILVPKQIKLFKIFNLLIIQYSN